MPRRSTKTAPDAVGKTGPDKPEKPRQSFGRWVWEWVKSLAAGFALFLFVRAFILQTWVITSGSMESTLLTGDLLVLNKVAYGAQIPGTEKRLPGYADIEHGDVVVFRAQHDTLDVIKRIIGMPGDTLEMRNKVLYRNGVKLEERYVQWSDPDGKSDGTSSHFIWQRDRVMADSAARSAYVPTRDNWGPIVVPPDSLFMMGDNRDDSLDSRFWGFLDQKRVKGKAEVVYFSYDREEMKPFAWIRDVRWGRIGHRIR